MSTRPDSADEGKACLLVLAIMIGCVFGGVFVVALLIRMFWTVAF